MKRTAKAPANIAFIKYWGKRDERLRIPLNDSLSMNLSAAYTVTTVEFADTYKTDDITLLDGEFSREESDRIVRGLDLIRKRAGSVQHARVVTRNSFPKGAGSAASASGFAALTVAAFAALGTELSEREMTVFARQGSGSACRSIPDGFVVWEAGSDSESSYAYSLYPPSYWDIRDLLVIVDRRMKKVSTTEGMKTVSSSPKLQARLRAVPRRMGAIRRAMKERNFPRFGEIMEEDCLDMHAVMQSQVPPLQYWNPITRRIMEAVSGWRSKGLAVYYTIDAGPNVHVICEGKDEERVFQKLGAIEGIQEIIRNTPAEGTKIIPDHLF